MFIYFLACVTDIQKECNINTTNNEKQTSLHIAAHQAHGRIVERLVGFGADLNLQVIGSVGYSLHLFLVCRIKMEILHSISL